MAIFEDARIGTDALINFLLKMADNNQYPMMYFIYRRLKYRRTVLKTKRKE